MKEKILSELKRNLNHYVSGETLKDMLGISRTAIWKHINGLKSEGYLILASPRMGYMLEECVDLFNEFEIMSQRVPKRIGKDILFFSRLDSTNNKLKEIARNGKPEGTVVIAEDQYAGKGRMGRSWMSSSGKGIWMSVLLRPYIPPQDVQAITLAVSVGIARALSQYSDIRPGIKWPNDILINGKKVCGILAEMSAEADRTDYIVIGMGINVLHTRDDFPEELKEKAISLLENNSGGGLSRSRIAASILDELDSIYDEYLSNGFPGILEQWKEYEVTLGKEVLMSSKAGDIKAKAVDVNHDGRLIIETPDGKTQEVLSGEISVRGLMGCYFDK